MRMPETKCLRREPSWETRSPAVTVLVQGRCLFYLYQILVRWTSIIAILITFTCKQQLVYIYYFINIIVCKAIHIVVILAHFIHVMEEIPGPGNNIIRCDLQEKKTGFTIVMM